MSNQLISPITSSSSVSSLELNLSGVVLCLNFVVVFESLFTYFICYCYFLVESFYAFGTPSVPFHAQAQLAPRIWMGIDKLSLMSIQIIDTILY